MRVNHDTSTFLFDIHSDRPAGWLSRRQLGTRSLVAQNKSSHGSTSVEERQVLLESKSGQGSDATYGHRYGTHLWRRCDRQPLSRAA